MAKKDIVDFSKPVDFSKIAARIIKIPLQTFVEESYLPYAHYVIMSRALISEDGLKPVQRRILYAMDQLGLNDKKDFMKAARIVGETMGKYHPHGDSSIGDALARMGQTFSLRVPLVDVHGSVGFTTGDDPAAPRYWEGRPTRAAMELLAELKEGAVEIGLNYDGKYAEPSILPIKWPTGLINGSQGIAVGYSSYIPPHNPTEVMDAAIALVKNPNLSIERIMKIIPGPDMPTGGILVGTEGVKDYYETGKGTFAVRGRYEIVPGARGTNQIIFSEAPYQVSPEQIVESVSNNKKDKDRFKEVSYVKDLSDIRSGFKLSIGIKAGANPEVVLRDLFRWTPLETKFSANMTVLKDGVPFVSNIKEILETFVEFRKYCILNKANFKLNHLNKEISRLDGIIKVLVDIDKAISIIRKSENSNVANEKLQKSFGINEEQSGFILSMPLRRLTKADAISIENEMKALREEKDYYTSVLSDEEIFKKHFIKELQDTKKVISDERRTSISNLTEEDLKAEAAEIKKAATNETKNVDCYVTLLSDGTVTRTESPFNEKGKQVQSSVKLKTQENLLVIKKDGTATKIPALYVPENNLVNIEVTTGISYKNIAGISQDTFENGILGVFLATTSGGVNIVNGKIPSSNEFEIMKLSSDEEVLSAFTVTEKEYKSKDIIIFSSDGYALRFPLEQTRTSNPGAGTIKGMNLNEGSKTVGAAVVGDEGVAISCSNKTIKTTDLKEIPSRNRSGKGSIVHKLKEDELINAHAGENVVATKGGKQLRIPEVSPRAAVGTSRTGYGITLGTIMK